MPTRLAARNLTRMFVVHHACLSPDHLDGETRVGLATPRRGVTRFEVWLRTLARGARTEALIHSGELVVLAFDGGGKLLIDGGPQRFQAPCTLLIPPHTPFQIVNDGATPLPLTWVFTAAPVALHGPHDAATHEPDPDPA